MNHTYWAAGPQQVTLTASDGIADAQTQVTVQVSGGGATIFCDDFTRVSDPSDSLSQPTTSALPAPCAPSSPLSWVENSGNLQISGGQLVNAPVKATHIATVGNLAGVDQTVTMGGRSGCPSPGRRVPGPPIARTISRRAAALPAPIAPASSDAVPTHRWSMWETAMLRNRAIDRILERFDLLMI